MLKYRLFIVSTATIFALVAAIGQARPGFAFGSDNECLVNGDCQAVVCDTSADTAITFGQAGAIAFSCNVPTAPGPNLTKSFAQNGGIAGAFASGVGVCKASADGAGSAAGAQCQLSTIPVTTGNVTTNQLFQTSGISTTAGPTGVALASAVHPPIPAFETSIGFTPPAGSTPAANLQPNTAPAAFGVSAFGGETIAAPNVVLAPGLVGSFCLGDAVASASTTTDSWMCVGNHVVIPGH